MSRCADEWLHEHGRDYIAELEAESDRLREGIELVRALRQACWDTGSPVVPTPVADTVRALVEWRDRALASTEDRR